MKRILLFLFCLGAFFATNAQYPATGLKQKLTQGVALGSKDSTAFSANDSLVLTIDRNGKLMWRGRGTNAPFKVVSDVATAGTVTNVMANSPISVTNATTTPIISLDTTFSSSGVTTRNRTKQQTDSLSNAIANGFVTLTTSQTINNRKFFTSGVALGTNDSTAYAANDSLVVVINRQGRMMYRSTDGYWKILGNAADTSTVLSQVVRTFGNQTVNGTKNFTSDLLVNGVMIGRGGGSLFTNTAIGDSSFAFNVSGVSNTTIGVSSLKFNTIGTGNAALGGGSLANNINGNSNTGIGTSALALNSSGGGNFGGGANALLNNTTGFENVGVGTNSGRFIADGTTANSITNNSIFIGVDSRALANNQTNQIVIGRQAVGLGSNTTVLGNASTVTTAIRGRGLFGTTVDDGSNRLQVTGNQRITGRLGIGLNPQFGLDISGAGVEGISNVLRTGLNGIGAASVAQFGSDGRTANDAVLINFNLQNSSSANVQYGRILTTIISPTAGAHSSRMTLQPYNAGTFVNALTTWNDGALTVNQITNNGADKLQVTGSGLLTSGLTAQRFRGTSLVLNKDSVPITSTNLQALFIDTSGTAGTNRVNRRNLANVLTSSITFDTTTRALTIPTLGGGASSVVIPRGTASGTSGIVALSSSKTGNLVTVSGDNGSSTTFSIRDSDSTATLQSLTSGNGLSGTAYNGSAPQTWNVDTSVISTKNNVNAGLVAKLNINDTAAMLSNRLRISDTASMLLNYARLSGANFTGQINTDRGIDGVNLGLNTLAGVPRWGMGLVNTESGSNTGSDLSLFSYNDDGTLNNFSVVINRATNALRAQQFNVGDGDAVIYRNSGDLQFQTFGSRKFLFTGGVANFSDIITTPQINIGNSDAVIYRNSGKMQFQTFGGNTFDFTGGVAEFNGGVNATTLATSGATQLATSSGRVLIKTATDNTVDALQVNGSGSFNGNLSSTGVLNGVGFKQPIVSKSANYTLTTNDYTVIFDCAAANRTVTLPVGVEGQIFVIKAKNASTNAAIITPNGSQTIEGNSTYSLSNTCGDAAITIQFLSGNWEIISSHIPPCL